MKSISKLFLGVALVSTGAFAVDVAPVLKSLKVSDVGNRGLVLKSSHQHPFSKFLIAIPAKIVEGSACTKFVGQTTTAPQPNVKAPLTITAVGASDPSVDACIQIFPMPVDTNLTVEMSVLTGGFVPAQPKQSMLVSIASAGVYKIDLDMNSNHVRVTPVKTK